MKDAGQKLGEYHKIFDYGKEVMSIRVLLTDKRYLINPHEENEHINLDGKKLGNELSLFTTNAQANLKRYLKSDGISYHHNTTYSTEEEKAFANNIENKTKHAIKDETLELIKRFDADYASLYLEYFRNEAKNKSKTAFINFYYKVKHAVQSAETSLNKTLFSIESPNL